MVLSGQTDYRNGWNQTSQLSICWVYIRKGTDLLVRFISAITMTSFKKKIIISYKHRVLINIYFKRVHSLPCEFFLSALCTKVEIKIWTLTNWNSNIFSKWRRPGLNFIKPAKHRKVLLNRNRLPAKITLGLPCCLTGAHSFA